MRLVAIGSRRLSLACLGTAALAAILLTGCAGGPAILGNGATVVRVSERDFRISAPKQVSAGDVVLRVHNRGPDNHELIVVRSDGSELPLRSDGLTVDEEALQRQEAGVLEPGQPNSTRQLRLHLSAGRYVLFCNMSGHYMGGMRVELVVR